MGYFSTLFLGVTWRDTVNGQIFSTVNLYAAIKVDLNMELAQKFLKWVDVLEDLDDVQQVYTNADISVVVMAQLNAAE